MTGDYFGKLLKDVRLARNMTQDQLSFGICSRRQLIRIENGEFEPSTHLIALFSQRLNFDLQVCYHNFKFSKTISAYELKTMLNSHIIKQRLATNKPDISVLKEIISKMEKLPEFADGENLQYLYYAHALYAYSTSQNDFNTCIQYCISGIQIEDPVFSLSEFACKNYSNIALSLISCIGCCYKQMNELENAKFVFENLLSIMDSQTSISYGPYYHYTDATKKIYQSTSYNLSALCYLCQDYKMSLHYVDKGISFSLNESIIKMLPDLLQKKFCILCRLKNFKEAKAAYEQAYSLAKLTSNTVLLNDLVKDYKELYTPEACAS